MNRVKGTFSAPPPLICFRGPPSTIFHLRGSTFFCPTIWFEHNSPPFLLFCRFFAPFQIMLLAGSAAASPTRLLLSFPPFFLHLSPHPCPHPFYLYVRPRRGGFAAPSSPLVFPEIGHGHIPITPGARSSMSPGIAVFCPFPAFF